MVWPVARSSALTPDLAHQIEVSSQTRFGVGFLTGTAVLGAIPLGKKHLVASIPRGFFPHSVACAHSNKQAVWLGGVGGGGLVVRGSWPW